MRLQWVLGIELGCGYVREQQVEQRAQVGAGLGRVKRGLAGACVAVDDRELDLRLVGIQIDEQLVDLVENLFDPRVRPVDLVDREDHRQLALERLAQHEPGLGQRALAGVDQQQHAIDHRQTSLHFSPEVRVAGRVDDVELDAAVADRGVLGEDRDPLLPFEVHRIEHPLGHRLTGAEGPRLPQQRVDERRLAVVDVRDDRDVADVGAGCHTGSEVSRRRRPCCVRRAAVRFSAWEGSRRQKWAV